MAHQSTKARAFVTSIAPDTEIDIKDPEPVEDKKEEDYKAWSTKVGAKLNF